MSQRSDLPNETVDLHGNTNRYNAFAITLHWVIALLITSGFVLGLIMVDMKLSPTKLKYFSWHKWIGISVLLLALLRLLWRFKSSAPTLPTSIPAWQIKAAHINHALLYVLMIVVPISGWLFSSSAGVPVVYLGLIELPNLLAPDKELAELLKSTHHNLNWLFLALITIHIGAALKHYFVDRDDVLNRMLPFLARRQAK